MIRWMVATVLFVSSVMALGQTSPAVPNPTAPNPTTQSPAAPNASADPVQPKGRIVELPSVSPAVAQAQSEISKQRIESGIEAMRAANFSGALEIFEGVMRSDPGNSLAIVLAGNAALEAGKPALAVSYLKKSLALTPTDWRLHFMLVRAYSAAGDSEERDAERVLIEKMHKDQAPPEVGKMGAFTVEVFDVAGKKVEATQFLEPYGKFRFRYAFTQYASDNKAEYQLALESDDSDNAIFQKMNKDPAKKGLRRYSLDGYEKTGQALFGFFDGEPEYSVVRARVVTILGDRAKAPPKTPAAMLPDTKAPDKK